MNLAQRTLAVFSFLVIFGVPGLLAKPDQNQYNVLLIVVDDLNTHLGAYGNEYVRSPAMDRLAAESLTMDAAYCQYPVCGPSRASFMTGLYPEKTTILSNEKRSLEEAVPGVKTLPEIFRDSGYWTANTGKMLNKAQDPGEKAWDEQVEIPWAIGAFREAFRLQWEQMYGELDNTSEKEAFERAWQAQPKSTQTPPAMGPYPFTDEETQDGRHVMQAISWMKARGSDAQPFFIALGISKPHVPFWAPEKYFEMYPIEDIPLPNTQGNAWLPKPVDAISPRYQDFGFQLLNPQNPDLARRTLQAYYACVTFIDSQFDQLFSSMRESGLWENTIIVLTSDNGYHLGENLMWGKNTLFQPSAQVPMIIRVPGMTKPGSRTSQLVELVDLLPTLTELCGIEVTQEVQGRSLRPLLTDPESINEEAAGYTILRRPEGLGRALRTPRWSYMLWGSGAEELYDRVNDPNEWNNLASLPSHTRTLERMREKLAAKRNMVSGEALDSSMQRFSN